MLCREPVVWGDLNEAAGSARRRVFITSGRRADYVSAPAVGQVRGACPWGPRVRRRVRVVAGRRLAPLALLALLIGSLLAGCKGRDDPRPLPSQSVVKPTLVGIPEGRPPLESVSVGERLPWSIADFPMTGERLLIVVEPHLWVHKRIGKEEDVQALFELLQAHAPWPYELKRRKMLAAGERPWATLVVHYQLRLDRLKWRKGTPSLGSLKFSFSVEARDVPKGYLVSWDGFEKKVSYTRPYEKFQRVDDEVRGLINGQLPGLVIIQEEQSRGFVQKMELRRELLEGKLPIALREPLRRIHEGGCLSTARGDGEAFYQIREPLTPQRVLDTTRSRSALCTLSGMYLAEAETRRSISLQFLPWRSQVDDPQVWQSSAHFERDIDLDTLRLLSDDQTLCLTGERRGDRERYGRVQCHDRATGAPLWGWSAPGTDLAAVAIYGQTIAVVTGRHITLFGLRDGQMLWQAEVEGATGITGRSRGCVEANTLIFSPSLGQHVAFDVANRRPLWHLNTSGSGLLYCDGQGAMYVDEAGGLLLALDVATHMPKWRFRLPGDVLDILYHGDHLMVLTQGALYALHTETGALVWQHPLNVSARRLLRHDRRLYLADDTTIYSLTRADRI
jgi:hypothetical protein